MLWKQPISEISLYPGKQSSDVFDDLNLSSLRKRTKNCSQGVRVAVAYQNSVMELPQVKFPCGLGVAVHHGRGTLAAVWPLGKPRQLPMKREMQGKLLPVQAVLRTAPKNPKISSANLEQPVSICTLTSEAPPELGGEYFQRPNFRVEDGVHCRYGLDGDLRWIVSCHGGALNGLCLRFEPEGFVRPQDSGIFKEGKLIERWFDSSLSQILCDAMVLNSNVYPSLPYNSCCFFFTCEVSREHAA